LITTKDIIIDPHATLRERAEEVKSPISDEDKAVLRGLLEYVIASQDDEKAERLGLKPGIGLAAPQINVSKRMIAVHIPDEEFPEDTVSYALYNPKIISNSAAKCYLAGGEGCLSVDKEIIAIGTTFDEYSYQIALLADKIYMLNTKQSCLYFRGYEYKEPYFKNILATLGVTVNTLHIGDYKVAGESFSHNKMTEEKKESLVNIKETLFQNFINLVKEKRKVDITNEILSGDLIFANSEKAKELGLIDGVSTYEEIGVDYDEDTVDFVEYISAYKRKKNKSKNTIAVINLEGEIDIRESRETVINYDNVVEKLEVLEDIKNLKGLVLRINSPGGSALESEKRVLESEYEYAKFFD